MKDNERKYKKGRKRWRKNGKDSKVEERGIRKRTENVQNNEENKKWKSWNR